VLKRIGKAPYWRYGRIRRDAIDREPAPLIGRFDIRTPSITRAPAPGRAANIQSSCWHRDCPSTQSVVFHNRPTGSTEDHARGPPDDRRAPRRRPRW